MYWIYAILLWIQCVRTQIKHQAVTPVRHVNDFVDKFKFYNSSLWNKENGYVYCDHILEPFPYNLWPPCVYASSEKVLLVYAHTLSLPKRHAVFDHQLLYLMMRNDCKGKQCCKSSNRCTQYTAGAITSRQTYPYGSFIFVAKAAGPEKVKAEGTWFSLYSSETVHHSISCFSLVRHSKNMWDGFDGSVQMEIALCVDSQKPTKVLMICRYGRIEYKKWSIRYDLTDRVVWYRIDWSETEISWFVNGLRVGTARQLFGWKIPNRPLHIKLYLSPTMTDSKQDLSYNLEFTMLVYRAAYFANAADVNHDELLVLGEKEPVTWRIPLITCSGSILIVAIICVWKYRSKSTDLSDRYELFEDLIEK